MKEEKEKEKTVNTGEVDSRRGEMSLRAMAGERSVKRALTEWKEGSGQEMGAILAGQRAECAAI